jgi:hypothetical protein
MAVSEESYLLDCWERVICPYCRKPFLETARVGSGRKKEGGFCSLDCYTKYYELDIRERFRRFVDPG